MALEADQERYSLQPIFSIVAISTLLMMAFQTMPEAWQHAIRYDRTAVGHGEIWRIVSGNYVHLGWGHFALNMVGLWLGTWLFGADQSPRYWLSATLAASLSTGAGLWFFSPTVMWCVGLSGVLHGLMVVGFGGWALAGERLALWLLLVVVGKMTWEQLGGDMPWVATMAGGQVITDAHVWGAAGGAAFLAGNIFRKGRQARV